MNYVHIKPLNAVLPAGSITHVIAFFESTSSHSLVQDWATELRVRSSEKIRQTARVFLDPYAAELLSVNGFEIRQINLEDEQETVEVEEEEEEKPRRGRKKSAAKKVVEEEEFKITREPLNFIDFPMLEISLNDKAVPLLQDPYFLQLCENQEVADKLMKSIRFHEKNIAELGEPAKLPAGLEEEEEEIGDSLTSTPSLTNDMMTANHQAYRAQQEELREKIEKRYKKLDNVISRTSNQTLSQAEVEALAASNGIDFSGSDFKADLNEIVVGFDF